MSKTQKLLLLCGLVLAVLAGVALLGHHSSSGRRLRTYKAELSSKGEKLTYAALAVPRSTNSSGSYNVFTNAASQLWKAKLDTGWLNLRQYIGPGQARAFCLQRSLATHEPGQQVQADWPEMAAELAKIEAPLDEIRVAMKDPQSQWCSGLFPGIPHFVAIRSAAQWISIHAVYEFHERRIESGVQDIEAILGLAQMGRDEYRLVAQMIRIAIARLGLMTTWEALQVSGWTEAQLHQLQSAWQAVDLADALESGLSGERAMGEEFWSTLRQTNGLQLTSARFARPVLTSANTTNALASSLFERVYFPVYRMTSIDDDELLYLKTMQGSLDALRSLRSGGPWPQARKELDATFAPLLRVTLSLERFRFPFSSIAIPNFVKAMQTGVQTETERQLVVTSIALKRSQLAHGEAPESLEALIPDYLPSAPKDLMSGRPLRYVVPPGAAPRLYSVGSDGEDNGGNASPTQPGKFGLWEELDAVWPAATADPH